MRLSLWRGILSVDRFFADEAAGLQLAQRLLDLGSGVHHERTITRDRLVQRPRGGEQETAAAAAGPGFHEAAVVEENQGGGADGLLLGTEQYFAVIDGRERGGAPPAPR